MKAKSWVVACLVALVATVAGAIVLAPRAAVTRAVETQDADQTATLRQRIAASPDDPRLHAQLGGALLQKARDEADPSYLPAAEEALRRSLGLRRTANAEAFAGLASLANARHEFMRSVYWARKAIEVNPFNANAYGSLGDALFELGRVRAADRAYDDMVQLRPNVSSYVRVSYALQYHGRGRAALRALRLALQAAGPQGETAAFVRHQIGDVYAGTGRIARAERQNRIGISIAPGFVPPTVGVAEAHIARGELDAALDIMESAVERLPSLEYMITLGELYEATGDRAAAERQYAEVAHQLRRYRTAGVQADADFTLFYADHGLRLKAALREARDAYRERPTPKVADALGWVHHALGRDRRAWRSARKAIRTAPADPGALFHAGAIARDLGRERTALGLFRRALRIDGRFSLVSAPIARRIVQGANRPSP